MATFRGRRLMSSRSWTGETGPVIGQCPPCMSSVHPSEAGIQKLPCMRGCRLFLYVSSMGSYSTDRAHSKALRGCTHTWTVTAQVSYSQTSGHLLWSTQPDATPLAHSLSYHSCTPAPLSSEVMGRGCSCLQPGQSGLGPHNTVPRGASRGAVKALALEQRVPLFPQR